MSVRHKTNGMFNCQQKLHRNKDSRVGSTWQHLHKTSFLRNFVSFLLWAFMQGTFFWTYCFWMTSVLEHKLRRKQTQFPFLALTFRNWGQHRRRETSENRSLSPLWSGDHAGLRSADKKCGTHCESEPDVFLGSSNFPSTEKWFPCPFWWWHLQRDITVPWKKDIHILRDKRTARSMNEGLILAASQKFVFFRFHLKTTWTQCASHSLFNVIDPTINSLHKLVHGGQKESEKVIWSNVNTLIISWADHAATIRVSSSMVVLSQCPGN